MCAWMCGSSKEGSEEEEEVQANSWHMWAMGWATSISEAYATYVHMYIHRGVAPGVVMWSGRAWARLLSCKLLGAEQHIG